MGWTTRTAGRGGRRRSAFVPRLNALEDRTLPSTFTVFSKNNSGFGSLRQAVLLANFTPGADVIRFAPNVTGTIALSSSLKIIDDVLIQEIGRAHV